MDIKSITKRISTVGVALSFVVLSACGGGGGDDTAAAPAPAPGSAEQIAEAQAALDASAVVSPLDYSAINAARTSCLVDGDVINTAAEIICYQAFLETIAPLEAPIV
jgi:hypothetical protein